MADESAVVFPLAGDRLLGMATLPQHPADLGFLILVGGRQYRGGSHRQFTLLARRLARADFCTFRFDFRGMGDSEGERRSFEAVDADIAAAIDAFRRTCPAVRRVVLFGLCDAATAAVLYWQRTRDPSVVGLCLANPWLRSDEGVARARVRHYYTERIIDAEFWKKLMRGRIDILGSLREYLDHWRRARKPVEMGGFRQLLVDGLHAFPGRMLFLLSGRDLTAKEFLDALASDRGLFPRENVRRIDLPEADHTFSRAEWREVAECGVESWLMDMKPLHDA